MKYKFKILSLLTLIMIMLVGCSNENKNKNEIVVGFDNGFIPMGYMDESSEIVGFDIDLAKETFKRLGMDVQFQSIDWSMKETELMSGNIDAIWNGYSLSEKRKKIVSYTDPYLQNKQVIVTLKNSSINNKSNLSGKTVGTQQGSTSLEAINKDSNFINSIKDKQPVLYDTYDKVFRDLEAKRVDAIVVDEILARYYISKKDSSKYKILNENFGTEDYVVAFSKDNTELKDKVNKTLKDIKKDSTFDEIYDKWFK